MVANVTVRNPSVHTFPLVLIAHTEESTGHQAGAGTPPGGSTSNTILLNETPSEVVVGEIRLNTGYPGRRAGAFDQVEINGSLGEDVELYNESYEPVTPPWEEGSYEYENASVGDDGGSDRLPLPGDLTWETVWSVVAVVAVGVVVVRRVRR